MAISLAKYVAEYSLSNEESSDVHRLVGKWLAETRSSKLLINPILYLILALNRINTNFSFIRSGNGIQLKNYFGEVFETCSFIC